MGKVKLVVFDIAGTTVQDNGEIALSFANALKSFGYSVPQEKINPLMGYKKTEAIKKMLIEFESDPEKITDEYVDSIHDKFQHQMIEYYSSTPDLKPMPSSEKAFEELKSLGISIGLDTGFPSQITDIIIKRLGWLKDHKIDIVVSSNQVPNGRPSPDMIYLMMERMSISNSMEVIKIGDTEVDINEGKSAGCLYSIGITTGAFTREELRYYDPSYILDDLTELLPIIKNAN
ncbi:MAG: phosphonatase-like hydrolase [Ginsengibacter sp.]